MIIQARGGRIVGVLRCTDVPVLLFLVITVQAPRRPRCHRGAACKEGVRTRRGGRVPALCAEVQWGEAALVCGVDRRTSIE